MDKIQIKLLESDTDWVIDYNIPPQSIEVIDNTSVYEAQAKDGTYYSTLEGVYNPSYMINLDEFVGDSNSLANLEQFFIQNLNDFCYINLIGTEQTATAVQNVNLYTGYAQIIRKSKTLAKTQESRINVGISYTILIKPKN